MTHSSSHSTLQALLERQDVSQALRHAKDMKNAAAFDDAAAEMLLKAAREWHAQGYADARREACELVLGVMPLHYEALHLLGFHSQARGDFIRSEALYEQALSIRPDFAFSQLALSQLRMLRTHFTEGRDGYEARFAAVTEGSGPDWRSLPVPRWRGESLAGKKLYLWAEQGLGDIVMFAGFLPPILSQSPARVALGMFPKLMTLFARSFPAIEVEPAEDAMNHALAPVALMSLPKIDALAQHAPMPFPLGPLRASYDYAKRHGLFDIAAPMGDLLVHLMPGYVPAQRQAGYLKADKERVARTRKRLDLAGQGRRVGISWHTTNQRETMRNIPLEAWLPLLETPGCHFVSLQHAADADGIRRFCDRHHCRITVDEIDPLADAEGLAALIASMDAVVTIDNANAHLAGALGVATALLLPRGHNFRWPELPGGGTLWYESVHAIRQREPGEWLPVMAEAAAWVKARA